MISIALWIIMSILVVANLVVLFKTKNGKVKKAMVYLFLSLLHAVLQRLTMQFWLSSEETGHIIVALPIVLAMLYLTVVFYSYNKHSKSVYNKEIN